MKRIQRNSRWTILFGLLVGSLLLWSASSLRVWAQDPKPTAAPEQPTKPPIEPRPTKVEQPPTDVPPTKELLPTVAPPTKTAVPTFAPTKTAVPPLVLTKTPLPMSPATQPAASPTRASAELLTTPALGQPLRATTAAPLPSPPAAVTASEPVSKTALVTITGVVFDDANDNGQRDPDEAGLPGVAVSVETAADSQTAITDASGMYMLPTSAEATVRVIVPAGWRTRQPDRLPIAQAGDFALRATAAAAPERAAMLTPLTITQSVIDFAPLIALGIGLGVVMAFGFLRTARAVSTSNRQLALLLVRMQRTSEKPSIFEENGAPRATDARVLALLNQAGLDASGQPLQIERVLGVTSGATPAITALGQSGRAAFIVFTPLEAKAFRQVRTAAPAPGAGDVQFEHATAYPLDRLDEALADGQAYPLDALSSGLFVADDLAAAYSYLAADLPVSARTLPRAARWTLFIAPLPKHDLAVRTGWRHRVARRLRR